MPRQTDAGTQDAVGQCRSTYSPGENSCPNARQKQGKGEKCGLERTVGLSVVRFEEGATDTLKVSGLLVGTNGLATVPGVEERGVKEPVVMGKVAVVVSSAVLQASGGAVLELLARGEVTVGMVAEVLSAGLVPGDPGVL